MKNITLLLLLISSCHPKEKVEFRYSRLPDGIIIDDYSPVSNTDLINYLTAINDTLQMDSIGVYLTAENISRLNPEFERIYFSSVSGRNLLNRLNNDTTKVLRDLSICFGTFKGEQFVKNEDWDMEYMNNSFLLNK